jgi:hypothetical protein
MITLYQAMGTHYYIFNQFDGEETDYVVGLYTTEAGARQAAEGKGRDGRDGKVVVLNAYENPAEQAEFKTAAIEALTTAQKIALGLITGDFKQ